MKKTTVVTSISLLSLAWNGLVLADSDYITLASTTSTENSGLFDAIIPQFTDKTDIDVRVVAVGTGQAFETARRGDADSLLVHDTEGEEQFVADGYATERQNVMYNDFVIVGPQDDPAGIEDSDSIDDAMQRIAESESPFASRGDDSGTHRAEQRLWESASIEPSGEWYRELGSGMGPTLNTAAGMGAYSFTDRATWVAFENPQDLTLLYEGDEALFNQYGSLLMSEDKHPHLKHDLAAQWHEWLVSEEGQQAIADYTVDGQQLFFPNAQ
ncbi:MULTISPECIES: substrate-binding domain-containing protein [unclassified Halomonas]|uniref:substrate-binding domain-containing protein n=1 Tax=unclassified Halomonas TaxID=2609666 RepID=UPI0006DBA975|nr:MULTISPECIES: substrate-binding domain-containing protein [unclassified Halomonas]KPQ21751.1 MAG: ABC-type tungstate uptake system substrate-binding component TupA [Halomonas sp. HL-93]SBR49836.1 tungstate transport system substrate-binding protein [Halomonas sp. HL-93]SNY96556.1 tungstate transport system substrate-binding protein [Halomonas sp. hl-4]